MERGAIEHVPNQQGSRNGLDVGSGDTHGEWRVEHATTTSHPTRVCVRHLFCLTVAGWLRTLTTSHLDGIGSSALHSGSSQASMRLQPSPTLRPELSDTISSHSDRFSTSSHWDSPQHMPDRSIAATSGNWNAVAKTGSMKEISWLDVDASCPGFQSSP